MAHCEDYPCCGHGPVPQGDGGGCPRDTGAGQVWPCSSCGADLAIGASSSLCGGCLGRLMRCVDEGCPGCPRCCPEEAGLYR